MCSNGVKVMMKSYGFQMGVVRSLLKDINSSSDSTPESFIDINGTYFFVADDGLHGKELWKSQGTVESTVLSKRYL